jgi:cytochrome c
MLRLGTAPRTRRAARVLLLAAGLSGCGPAEVDGARFKVVVGGDPARGQALLERYQCGSCHAIPGVASAAGRSAPSLERFGARSYIAGQLPNLPATLVRWIRDPQALVPGTRMPDMGATEADARDMAAFLMAQR